MKRLIITSLLAFIACLFSGKNSAQSKRAFSHADTLQIQKEFKKVETKAFQIIGYMNGISNPDFLTYRNLNDLSWRNAVVSDYHFAYGSLKTANEGLKQMTMLKDSLYNGFPDTINLYVLNSLFQFAMFFKLRYNALGKIIEGADSNNILQVKSGEYDLKSAGKHLQYGLVFLSEARMRLNFPMAPPPLDLPPPPPSIDTSAVDVGVEIIKSKKNDHEVLDSKNSAIYTYVDQMP